MPLPHPAHFDHTKLELVSGHRHCIGAGTLFFHENYYIGSARKLHFDGRYRTVFGPAFQHNGVIYCVCPECLNIAFQRVSSIRVPEEAGKHQLLYDNQSRFFSEYHSVYQQLADRLAVSFFDFESAHQQVLLHVDDPHPKRVLRQAAHAALDDTGGYGLEHWVTRRHKIMKAFMKPQEWAKPKKCGRIVFDLGVEASLQGSYILEMTKDAICGIDYPYRGGHIRVVKKVTNPELVHCFTNLIHPPGRYYYCLYSDDACASFYRDGIPNYLNIDISKCDQSHGTAIFTKLYEIFPAHIRRFIKPLIDQCSFDVQVKNPLRPKDKVVYKLRRPILPSGSTLTTMINNIASLAIAICLVDSDFDRNASERAGYMVTFEQSSRYVDIMFLKHIPLYDTEMCLRAFPAVGIMLRASGCCKGDLQGSGNFYRRALEFQARLLHGIYPRASFSLLDKLLIMAGGRPKSFKPLQSVFVSDYAGQYYTVSDQEWCSRYGIDQAELMGLLDYLNPVDNQTLTIQTSASRKILAMDYGL